jgi:hypothetical protein
MQEVRVEIALKLPLLGAVFGHEGFVYDCEARLLPQPTSAGDEINAEVG